jgi:hypothetical protein
MRTNADITIYNKYISSGAEKYQRAAVVAVAWENRKARNVLATGGDIAANQATIYIPWARGTDYIGPKAWQALSVKTGKWTLQNGDIVVRGVIADEIHDAVVSPPSAAFTPTMLKAKYDDVLTISSVDTMNGGSVGMWHWQIGAK